ncbi:MAG: hypothetical protein C5B60_00425 [Chloroflexi bacterium]|nr:MAG: hypothetical protein C5B60_00425 [Chloroflexota bacterium]
MADSGSATSGQVKLSITNVRSRGTGLTWPPELPFSFALERARELDQSALGMLYRRFMPVVYRYALARVGTVHLAEEVTSETFFAVVEAIKTMRAHDELGFVAWLLGIARHKIAMHFRRVHVRPDDPWTLRESEHPLATAEEGDPLLIVMARESWEEVVVGLNQLTDEQRAVLFYRFVLEYSTEDTARLLEKRPNAIRALQFRALASLTRHLDRAKEASDPREHNQTPSLQKEAEVDAP